MNRKQRFAVVVGALIIAGLVGTRAQSEEPAVDQAAPVPTWAKVAPEQIAEAKKHGVPVAFENELGMRFVLIPAGKYMRGYRPDRLHMEGPNAGPPPMHRAAQIAHEVTLTRPYYMQIHEVTYGHFRHHKSGHGLNVGTPPRKMRDRQPVAFVSWDDAVKFAVWLSHRDPDRTYRLPTDAQWEYACRAGTTTLYWFGEEHTDSAGRGPANPWGVLGVYTTPHEYCSDWFAAFNRYEIVNGEYVFTGIRARTDPTGPKQGTNRVTRGIWSPGRGMAGSSNRGGRESGFRLVSPLPEKDEE